MIAAATSFLITIGTRSL